MTPATGGVLTRGTVVIDVEACKGCELCIPACPPEVLVMTTTEVNAVGFRYPLLLPGCTGCRACLDVCPDFCFEVYKYDEPRMEPAQGTEGEAQAPGGRAEEVSGRPGASVSAAGGRGERRTAPTPPGTRTPDDKDPR